MKYLKQMRILSPLFSLQMHITSMPLLQVKIAPISIIGHQFSLQITSPPKPHQTAHPYISSFTQTNKTNTEK